MYLTYLKNFGLLIISVAIFNVSAQTGTLNSRHRLLKSASTKEIVETARSHQWSIDFTKRSEDTLHIIAIRVDFQRDTSSLTTGDGRFGIRGDDRERRFYNDGTYTFDLLPHDSLYFAEQLNALSRYYSRVSRGSLTLDFSIFPAGSGEDNAYTVPEQKPFYSPGWKRRRETTDQYWDRKTHGLMTFVRDAIRTAGNRTDSPFRNLYRDDSGILRDIDSGRKAVILVFHAGASYMTDGGLEGAQAANTPSDMIDAFIDPIFFKLFQDTLDLDAAGITVMNSRGESVLIDEVMMCSETSNQDGLNWGIQGLLVNQMARQLGIPDLFSTTSGISAVGAFCIMDFAGYSAGQGFIPPYPSAWVRAFMGWDTPRVVGAGGTPYRVQALTSILDGGIINRMNGNDTTILLIPINNNEYYLVENRQRNLSGNRDIFRYDLNGGGDVINSYPFNVNLDANVMELSPISKVLLEAKNSDVSLPASGVLVWHVDERVIRQRLAHNFINADSSYRGVRLVEADGINDIGVMFIDAFYQAAFDYGGAEDVFPHTVRRDGRVTADVWGFGPYSRPSTRSNDGGHSYLNIDFNHASVSPRRELSLSFQNDTVINYSDSNFIMTVTHDFITQGWPRRAAPDNFFDPLVANINESSSNNGNSNSVTVLALLGESGRFYLYSVNGERRESYGNFTANIALFDYKGNPADTAINITFFDTIPGAFTFPTAIENRIYVPSLENSLHIYNSLNINDKETLTLPAAPSTYVCGISNRTWVVGLADGRIVTGAANNVNDTAIIPVNSNSPVNAIAVLKDNDDTETFTVIQDDGTLSIIKSADIIDHIKVPNGIPPFTLVTGNLDNNTDGKPHIVVTDSRQGVWVYTRELRLAQGWTAAPNDWANIHHIDPQNRATRERYSRNHSAPALADLSRDGTLDIIVGGTNGVYALNRKGALLSRWPAYLDNRYWNLRGSIATSPIVASTTERNQPLVLFSSPTGERLTFGITKIETADKARGVVTFRRENGTLDSLWDLSAATIDTILTLGDSLIYPYILPGGFVDALGTDARRPVSRIGSWPVPQSRWPLSTGAPVTTSPLIHRDRNAGNPPDLFAVASDGMVYRWQLHNILSSDTIFWPQNGFDAARSFAYGGAITREEDFINPRDAITFWNFPNPTSRDDTHTTFKYQFSGPATNVRLDIYSITGRRMDTFRITDGLTGDFPGWNEFRVNLRKYGPGIYRCRMEAHIGGRKYSKIWNMAVVK